MGRLALPLLFVSLVFTGCSSSQQVAQESTAPIGTVFRFAQGPEPRTLDPAFITDAYASFIAANLFEGLLVWNSSATELLPGLAERHELGEDGSSYTFHLRRDAIWSNGDPVTATDFVVAWRRVLDPEGGSPYAALLYPIRGARELHQGEVRDAALLGVEARDRHTLHVALKHPSPWFPAICAHSVTAPVNARTLKRHGYAWTRPDNIVVNGAFTLHEWNAGKELVLARNPYYYDANAVKLDRVVARVEASPEDVLKAYETGQLDWTGHAAGLLPLARLDELAARPDARVHPQLGTSWFTLNTSAVPFSDVRVRRALNLALNRDDLDSLIGPLGVVTSRFVPPGMHGYEGPKGPSFDPEGARGLLAEAGFAGGQDFPSIELAVDDRNVHKKVAHWVAASWREHLGIEATVFARVWGVHADAVERRDFQVARSGWLGDYPDPSNFLELFLSDNAFNSAQWADRAYDGMVRESGRTADAESRLRLLAEAEAMLLDEAPIVPLFHFGAISLLKPEVRGYVDNALDVHLLKYLSVAETSAP